MPGLPLNIRLAALALLLSATACHPDAPTTRQPPAVPAKPATATAPVTAVLTDTLHLPGSQILSLLPGTAAAFTQAAADSLPDLDAESPDQQFQGSVRRQGLALVLAPARGPVVRLTSTPPLDFKNDSASVRYVYRGSLRAAHQWVVQAWFWESDGTVLIDQHTGRRLLVYGWPTASPDGRYVLVASPGLGGGDQINSLSLVEITAAGPRLLWQRTPESWAPERARWAGPGRALLKIARADADGQLPEPPRPDYLLFSLPVTP